MRPIEPTAERLLAEVDDLLRSLPASNKITAHSVDVVTWLGRVQNLANRVGPQESVRLSAVNANLNGRYAVAIDNGYRDLQVLLHGMRHNLLMQSATPTTLPFAAGSPYDYFDEVRRVISRANTEIFYVDPYLDADFVARYLPQSKPEVPVRLLTSERKLASLLAAVDVYYRQHSTPIAVRTSAGLHDRYLFVDAQECFQSGASFKDGAVKAPTILSQIQDAFGAVWTTYADLWSKADVQR